MPTPISSSAHIIPSLSIPLILDFLILNDSFFIVISLLPTGATITFCPTATLGAPQIILRLLFKPTLTSVNFNLSAFGCFSHLTISPINSSDKLVRGVTYLMVFSTSRPISVSKSEVS